MLAVAGAKPEGSPMDARALDDPDRFTHRTALLNGARWHFVDEGTGPLVLLLHGFPYSWYGFRKLIPALVGARYRAVAPDLLGYAGSDAPDADARYAHVRQVGDLVALLRVLGERSAILVGHDVGASLAFAAAQMRPDLFRALVLLNTPQTLRGDDRPSDAWQAIRAQTGGTLYQEYFAGPQAVRELDADVRRSLRAIMVAISGSAVGAQRWRSLMAPGERFLDTVFDPPELPAWLSTAAIDCYASQYAARGFAGPLASYRCRDLNWEWGAFLADVRPAQPSLFIGGASDPASDRLRPAYDRLEDALPGLRGKTLLDGVGHSAVEEAPEAVARIVLPFLAAASD